MKEDKEDNYPHISPQKMCGNSHEKTILIILWKRKIFHGILMNYKFYMNQLL